MGRSPLAVGTYGAISYLQLNSGSWRAQARYRDHDGKRRDVYGFGATKAKAADDLRVACRDRLSPGDSDLTADSKVATLVALWLAEVDASDRAPATKEVYRDVAERHVVAGLGDLRLRELTVGRCDRFIKAVAKGTGPAVAKTARTVLSGACGLATRQGALATNPIRDIARISQPKRQPPKAATREQLEKLILTLRQDRKAKALDLPDLLHFMVGTGCRIGEAMAVRRTVIDLEAGTVIIDATVQRLKGQGVVLQRHPKTSSSVRTLTLPPDVLSMLKRRMVEGKTAMYDGEVLLFPSPLGKLRDRSNTTGRLREAFDRAGEQFAEFSSHGFRKSVMTWFDEAGVTARQTADQAGHAKVSMTQDVYFGRGKTVPAAAQILAMPGLESA